MSENSTGLPQKIYVWMDAGPCNLNSSQRFKSGFAKVRRKNAPLEGTIDKLKCVSGFTNPCAQVSIQTGGESAGPLSSKMSLSPGEQIVQV